MTKYVAISLVAILLAACNSSKNPHSSSGQEEDLSAKELLQGIWLDDETESPLMRIEGDTIYYADSQSAPITFKIIRDTLYTYGNDTNYYLSLIHICIARHLYWSPHNQISVSDLNL